MKNSNFVADYTKNQGYFMKNVCKMALIGFMLMTTLCVQAQDLGSILNGVLGGGGDDMISNLTSVFKSDKQANSNNIIGTWSYSEPAIVFTSNNVLTKVAAKVAAGKVEKKLQSYLDQYGLKQGAVTLTFKEDGTLTGTRNGKSLKGQWAVKDSKLQLIVAGIKTPLQLTTQIDGKNLQFVTDATKLLNLFKTLGAKSTNKNIQTVTSLMKSVNGMQAGVTLRKQ